MFLYRFTIEGNNYDILPFIFNYDGDDIYRLNYTGAYGNPPGTYFYSAWSQFGFWTGIDQLGDVISLKDAFYETYRECRTINAYKEVQNVKCCEVTANVNGVDVDYSIYYDYIYDPATPYYLKIQMHGNVNGSYGTRPTTLDYAIEGTSDTEQITIAQIRLHNNPMSYVDHEITQPYEGSSSIYIGCIAKVHQAFVNRQVTWLPDQFEWVTHPELAFDDRSMYDANNVDDNANTMMTVGNYEVFVVEHHSYPNRCELPVDPPYYGGYGYSLLNTDDVDKLYINGVEWVDDYEDDSQEDFSDTHNYSTTSYVDHSDPVPPDGLPYNSLLDTGFIHAYCLGESNSRALANYMLTDTFLNAVKHLYDNTIDYILSYVTIPVKPSSMTLSTVQIGGVDTGIDAQRINNNFVEFNSKVKLKELWGGFADYCPLTRVSCYIPFVGIQELNTDDVMSGDLVLNYRIDVLTGIFNCSLSVKNSRDTNGVLYTYEGCMASNIPLFSSDVSNKLNSIKSTINASLAVASGGSMALPAAAMSMAESAATKPSIARSGSLSVDAGFLGNYTPYLIIERPVQALPTLYKNQQGYPTRESGAISKFSGFLQVETVDLSGIACTDSEREEILQLLQEGVYV